MGFIVVLKLSFWLLFFCLWIENVFWDFFVVVRNFFFNVLVRVEEDWNYYVEVGWNFILRFFYVIVDEMGLLFFYDWFFSFKFKK